MEADLSMDRNYSVIATVCMYIGIGNFVTPATQGFFKASLLATIMIPILLYGYLLVYRVIKGRNEEEEEVQKPKDKGFAEAFSSKKKDNSKQ